MFDEVLFKKTKMTLVTQWCNNNTKCVWGSLVKTRTTQWPSKIMNFHFRTKPWYDWSWESSSQSTNTEVVECIITDAVEMEDSLQHTHWHHALSDTDLGTPCETQVSGNGLFNRFPEENENTCRIHQILFVNIYKTESVSTGTVWYFLETWYSPHIYHLLVPCSRVIGPITVTYNTFTDTWPAGMYPIGSACTACPAGTYTDRIQGKTRQVMGM